MTLDPNAHTLSLTSKRVDQAIREMIYEAKCSCGAWSFKSTATKCRAEHAAHLQRQLGPDRDENIPF